MKVYFDLNSVWIAVKNFYGQVGSQSSVWMVEPLQCPFGLNCEWDANEQVYDILSSEELTADKLTSSHCDKGAHCCLKKGDWVHK